MPQFIFFGDFEINELSHHLSSYYICSYLAQRLLHALRLKLYWFVRYSSSKMSERGLWCSRLGMGHRGVVLDRGFKMHTTLCASAHYFFACATICAARSLPPAPTIALRTSFTNQIFFPRHKILTARLDMPGMAAMPLRAPTPVQ